MPSVAQAVAASPPSVFETLWPWFVFVVAMGACVGSFLNVVVYRLPAGESLVRPASRCPRCGHGLAWYDNIPVLGWFLLRGRCRYCGNPIALQYPLVEAVTAITFGWVFCGYYVQGIDAGLARAGLEGTWPLLLVHLAFAAALIAATKIDARLFIIPLSIPYFVVGLAMAGLPAIAAWWPATLDAVPMADGRLLGATFGGVAGLAVAVVLLRLGVLPLSFADEATVSDATADQPPPAATAPPPAQRAPDRRRSLLIITAVVFAVAIGLTLSRSWFLQAVALMLIWWVALLLEVDEPDEQQAEVEPGAWLAYPHPRREMLKEMAFLSLPALGAAIGWWLTREPDPLSATATPLWLSTLAGVLCGYLVGAATVWFVRILGTLGFGKEAMGLGDVHLVGAIGAVLGPVEAVLSFFGAAVLGVLTLLLTLGLAPLLRGRVRVIPFGPYLAAAAVLVMVYRRPLLAFFGILDG